MGNDIETQAGLIRYKYDSTYTYADRAKSGKWSKHSLRHIVYSVRYRIRFSGIEDDDLK